MYLQFSRYLHLTQTFTAQLKHLPSSPLDLYFSAQFLHITLLSLNMACIS
jgi:hypothetical protein